MYRVIAAAIAAIFCFSALPAAAATTGMVRGTILVNDKAVAGVSVTLLGEGSLLHAVTDNAGHYVFSQVPFGDYTLSASYPGVAEKKLPITVASDQILTVNFALGVLKTIASANVFSRAGASGNPVSQNVLTRQQLAALPTNGSLNNLVQTVPGIVKFSYNEPVANGFHGLTYEIDGAPIPQATTSNFAEMIDPKSIDSLEVYTGAFPAEYGGNRMGAVVNIQTDRLADLQRPEEGSFSIGAGNFGQSQTSLNEALKLTPNSELFFNANAQNTNRGVDTPTYSPIHDNSSQSDQFLRYIASFGQQNTLAFDFSNQLSQFQIPINTDPNNPIDPQVSPAGTDDVQREYDRYANLNLTHVSKDGNGVFQFIPWVRYTRVAYDGDLANDVQATQGGQNLAGLRQDQRATYTGVRLSQFRASAHHAIKVGVDFSRENYAANTLIAAPGTPNPLPYTASQSSVAQPGTQTGIYAEDKWSPSRMLTVNYGVRYDHSTGFTSGSQISPRIGVNIAPDDKNVVHVYYGRMYAAPQLEDVRGACVVSLGCDLTNIPYDLQPERDAYFEMGVAHTFRPGLSGYVNYFRRTAVNILDTTQLLNTPLFAVFNNAIGRDEGVDIRLQGNRPNGDSWFVSSTISHSEAGDISGGLFLFCPPGSSTIPSCGVNSGRPFTAADLAPEDHDQTYEANGAYTHRFGANRKWFATLQSEYGTGYPVNFQAGVDRLPAHMTFDLGLGKDPGTNSDHSLGFSLDVQNLLNHQYVIKIANGFNTTQIAQGRGLLFRVTAPF